MCIKYVFINNIVAKQFEYKINFRVENKKNKVQIGKTNCDLEFLMTMNSR